MSEFLHPDHDDTMAIAIPRVFSENSRAKNGALNGLLGVKNSPGCSV